MTRAVLTGGAGLIGSHLADLLVVQRDIAEVVVYDDFSRGTSANLAAAAGTGKLRVVRGDVRDSTRLEPVLAGADVVFHLAAIRITQCAREPVLAHDVLAGGTLAVADAAARQGVGKLVFSSTASVYGLAERFPTPETAAPWPNRTLYGAAKAYGEGVLRSYADTAGLRYLALRYFNVYGPRMDTAGAYTEVMIRWMTAIDRGERPVIFGDGAATMDFVYVGDVARANLAAWRADAADEVCNVATGVETSLTDLATALAAAMGRPDLTPVYEPDRATPGGVTRRLADTRRAERLLGFRARVGLAEGLRRLVGWWRLGREAAA
jgi:UDP-glucose 4-epimerase